MDPSSNSMLKRKLFPEIKKIFCNFSYPYNRRIAGQHGHFTVEDYRKWLKKAERNDLTRALRRLVQLNQSKEYLFWKCSMARARASSSVSEWR